MRYIDVHDDYVSTILEANQVLKNKNLSESTEFVVEENEGVEHEVHACPLCESELDEPISEENMQECVQYIAAVLNEAHQLSEELESEEYEEELYEADDEEDDDEEEDDEDDDKEDDK